MPSKSHPKRPKHLRLKQVIGEPVTGRTLCYHPRDSIIPTRPDLLFAVALGLHVRHEEDPVHIVPANAFVDCFLDTKGRVSVFWGESDDAEELAFVDLTVKQARVISRAVYTCYAETLRAFARSKAAEELQKRKADWGPVN